MSPEAPKLDSGDLIELSVIIAVKNAAQTLGEQLKALVDQEWSGTWEILVADNGSTDGSRSVAERFSSEHPRVRMIDASAHVGAGPARDAAMNSARGLAFAFCDADDVVEPGWVEALGDALRNHRFVAGSVRFDRLNAEWLRRAYYTNPPTALESFEGIFPIAPTCNLGVRREAIELVGGFDVGFLTGQDLELCLRLWRAGVELQFIPSAVVQYRYRPTLCSLWRRSIQYGAVGPKIARRLSSMGEPTPPRFAGLRNWLWLVRHLGLVRTKQGQARWLVVAGTKIGRLAGSIRERSLYL